MLFKSYKKNVLSIFCTAQSCFELWLSQSFTLGLGVCLGSAQMRALDILAVYFKQNNDAACGNLAQKARDADSAQWASWNLLGPLSWDG
jgi:hypothetical protein